MTPRLILFCSASFYRNFRQMIDGLIASYSNTTNVEEKSLENSINRSKNKVSGGSVLRKKVNV